MKRNTDSEVQYSRLLMLRYQYIMDEKANRKKNERTATTYTQWLGCSHNKSECYLQVDKTCMVCGKQSFSEPLNPSMHKGSEVYYNSNIKLQNCKTCLQIRHHKYDFRDSHSECGAKRLIAKKYAIVEEGAEKRKTLDTLRMQKSFNN